MSENEHPPLENPRVRRQLAQLFGESLFGPWREMEPGGHVFWHEERVRYSFLKTLLLRLASIAALVGIGWGGYLLVKPGLKKSDDEVRANLAQELQTFIDDGTLERASAYVELVRNGSEREPAKAAASTLDPQDPHLDLILTVEAALYRYFDAEPKRLESTDAFLNQPNEGKPLRQLAVFTLQSREERAARIHELERLRSQFPNRNEPSYLLATALELGSNVQAAREAWVRAAQLGPAWLGQRFEQSWFEARQREAATSREVVNQMVRVDPESPWTRFAIERFAPDLPVPTSAKASDAGVAQKTRVQTYFEYLLKSIDAQKHGNDVPAKEHLAAAGDAINNQAPFLFDAFDWLLAENLPTLARALTELPKWPRENALATSKVSRLPALVAPSTPIAPPKTKQPAKSPKPAKVSKRPRNRKK